MQRTQIFPKMLALAVVVVAAGLALAHSGAAHANPSGGSTSPNSVDISGTSYQELAHATLTTQVTGPISATGSVTASLNGGNEWDTASCFLALDGTPFGPQVDTDLTSQQVVYDSSFDVRNAQLDERNIQVIGFSRSVPAGTHFVSLECDVLHGSDTVIYQGASTVALSEPASGSIVNGLSLPAYRETYVADTTITTTWTGPIVVMGSAGLALQGSQQWDDVNCDVNQNSNLAGSESGTYPHNHSDVYLSTEQTGAPTAMGMRNRALQLQHGGIGVSDRFAAVPPGTYTFQLECDVVGADTVSVPHAGIIVVAPAGATDDGDTGPSDPSAAPNALNEISGDSITTTAQSSRLVALGSTDVGNPTNNEWDTVGCNLQVSGTGAQATGPLAYTTFSTQSDTSLASNGGFYQNNLHPSSAPLNPYATVTVPAGTYNVGMYCEVFSGSDTVAVAPPTLVVIAVPNVTPTLPAPLTTCGSVPATSATYVSNPSPTTKQSGNSIAMRKELNGYPAYGADGRADVLYNGQAATWTFTLPAGVNPSSVASATVKAGIAADDHTTSLSGYTLKEWTNGDCRLSGPAGVQHGMPYGGPFTNWSIQSEPSSTGGATYTVTIANTGGDWYAVDWIELDLTTQ